MRTQVIRLTDLEAETLHGFVAELLDDLGIDSETRLVLDSIYQKIDSLDEIEEN